MTNTKNVKHMICAYCRGKNKDDTCRNCEFNPQYTNNFEIGDNAKLMIEEGVLTKDGCVNLVTRLNSSRLDNITALFRDTSPVADSDKPDNLCSNVVSNIDAASR